MKAKYYDLVTDIVTPQLVTHFASFLNPASHLSNEITYGGAHKCDLPKKANLHFGSGGSEAIIAVTTDKAFKYFPLFMRLFNGNGIQSSSKNEIKYEIYIMHTLTKNIIMKKKTPHIVEFY